MIGAEFLAILIIIIYIGAISILFLFVIMMLNLRIVEVYNSLINIFPLGIFLGIFFFFEFFFLLEKNYFISSYLNNDYVELDLISYSLVYSKTNLYYIGEVLFNYYSVFLIISGLILLLAMLGSIILTKDTNTKNKNIFLIYRNKSTVTFWGLDNNNYKKKSS
jgi:NADH:ubiquinone oxidoreductase subunit 6 (subunit J)